MAEAYNICNVRIADRSSISYHNGHRCLGDGGAILSFCLPPEMRHAQTYGWWQVYEEKEGKVGCSISRRLRSLHYKRN
jgi:hypothetical protein